MKIEFARHGRIGPRSWHHGDEADPSQWPSWKLFHLSFLRLDVRKPNTAFRLWIYTRYYAYDFDLYLHRRSRPILFAGRAVQNLRNRLEQITKRLNAAYTRAMDTRRELV